jgi:hypothetical protein
MGGRRERLWGPDARAGAGREGRGQTSAERRGGEDLSEAFYRLKRLIEEKEAELEVEDEKTKIVRKDFEEKAEKVEDLKKEIMRRNGAQEAASKKETMVKVWLFQAGVHHPAGPPHHLATLPGSHLLPLARLQALCPGHQVAALKRRQGGKSKGWTAAKVHGTMVHPPAGGWRERDYVLFFS